MSNKPFIVVNVNYVFPDEKDENGKPVVKPVFVHEPAKGKCQYSGVVLNEIAGALRSSLVIIGESVNPENTEEVNANEQKESVSYGFHQESE